MRPIDWLTRRSVMIVDLSQELAEELRDTLDQVIGEMSGEIADTDNPAFRRDLESRRERLRSVRSQLDGAPAQ
jgi:predicted aconitase